MQIEEIIDRFKSKNGFVENFDLIVEYLKANNFSIEDINETLMQILKYNQDLNDKIKKENDEIEKMIRNRQCSIESESEIVTTAEELISHFQLNDSKLDISYYKIQIDNCKNLDELESLLPKKTVENFDELINLILLCLLEEEMEFKQMLYENSETLDSDPEISNYVTEIHRKFEIIKNYRDYKEMVQEEVDNTQNRLIFLTTAYGNVCALSDIKSIDSEYYGAFLNLLQSIINGTFKNVKSFTVQGSGTVMSEVKDFKIRIVFVKLEPNVYIINSIFVKKVDSDLSYRNNLINRDALYRNKIVVIRGQLNGNNREEFLKENDLIKDEIVEVLKSGIKVKSLGDNSGKIS